MRKKRISFKTKVLVPIIAISVVSVLIISIINYGQLNAVVEEKTNANLEIFAGNILAQINHLDIILESTRETLEEKHTAIARTVAHILDNAGRELSAQELQQLASLLDIIELNVADSDGIIVNSNRTHLVGDDFKTTETTLVYLALTDGTLTHLSEEPRASILPDFSLGEINHYTAVARSGGGTSRGFVQLGFNADVIGSLREQISINKTIKETKIGDSGFGFVLSQGIIIAHPDEDMLGKDVSAQQWYKTAGSGSGFGWLVIEGERYYTGFKNENDYTVAGLLPQRDYYRELYRILIGTAVFLLIAIIIMAAVVYFVLGRLLLPVNYLVKGLEKIAETKMNARIEGSYNDEYDKIKNAVNSMAEEIKNHMNLISGIEYAGKIQKNLLPPENIFREAFEDYNCLWRPKDIVSGDIYWIKNFPAGAVLCVCDCTGHGTPGALLTMLVMSIFENTVSAENCSDTAQIIWELEKHLTASLNVHAGGSAGGITINNGCDLAALFIARNGSVNISAGNTNVFICDGQKVTRLRGQKIQIGDGKIKRKEDINVINIPSNPNNKFYIATDGLYEQIGSLKEEREILPFGFERLEKIILENHAQNQKIISEKIWNAFEEYRGENARKDDFQLISFKPKIKNGGEA